MRSCRFFIVVSLLLLTACAAPPPPTPTLIPSFTPTLTTSPSPTLPHSPVSTPTPPHSSLSTPAPSPTPTSTPVSARARLDALLIEPPPRPFDYIVVNAEPPRRVPNATRSFWVADGAAGGRREITARLRVQTEHTAMWIEENVWHDVQKLQDAASSFETQVYPTTRAAFGSEWMPGVDNDPHIHILHIIGLGEGVLGYTSSVDEFPRALYPLSNEAEMMVVNLDQVEVGSPTYYALLAHQFQRIIQWSRDRNEERWVREGLAELAVRLNGFDPGESERIYLRQPDISLVTWWGEGTDPLQEEAHRGAAYLFASFCHERLGDEGLRALVAQPLNGIAGLDAVLAELGTGLAFEDIFSDWLAANYLDSEPGVDSPRYGYAALDLERPAAAVYETYPATVEASVQQFGADYILLRGSNDLHIRFTGAVTTSLLDVLPHSGSSFWWSNRADESLTTLTRSFDLSGISNAEPVTLTYWTWYDIEQGYDYATVEVSADGGKQWHILPSSSGTDDDPHGSNPGWGYTGQSDHPPRWMQETVDLSPYVGGGVLVRFAYLTDEAVTGMGFALDDISIPKIGYTDDVEGGESGWESAGFVRSDHSIPQRYLALLIGLGEIGSSQVSVERLPVGENNLAEWTAPLGSEGWREAVIVLSGLTPLASYPAPYQLRIE
jgi:immune inhibitor A